MNKYKREMVHEKHKRFRERGRDGSKRQKWQMKHDETAFHNLPEGLHRWQWEFLAFLCFRSWRTRAHFSIRNFTRPEDACAFGRLMLVTFGYHSSLFVGL